LLTPAHPLYTGMISTFCFILLLCLFIISDIDLVHFLTLLLLHVKRLQLKIELC